MFLRSLVRLIACVRCIGQTSGGAAPCAELSAEGEELDWRLQGPNTKPNPSFKPGTSTWDTDTLKEAAKIKKATSAAAQADLVQNRLTSQSGTKLKSLNPAEWWAMHYKPRYEESVQTVGDAARSFTSTTAAVTTKNELVRRLKSRCVPAVAESLSSLY